MTFLNSKFKNLIRVLILVIAFVFLLSILGLGFAHPKSGLKNALGPASSSLAVYYDTKNISKGSKVVVNTGQPNSDPALSIVNSVDKQFVHIQSGTMLQAIDLEKSVKGKLILVIPFAGYLFNALGL